MSIDSSMVAKYQLVHRVRVITYAAVCLAVILLAVAIFWPINTDSQKGIDQNATMFTPLPTSERNVESLTARMAGAWLIRPTQVKAAVKDTGAAQRLLKNLKLQGVVEMDQDMVAYIAIEKQGVKSIRQGDKILDFIVESVQPGEVKLLLDGVSVSLTN